MSDFTDLIRACDERVRLGPCEYPASDYSWGIKKVPSVDELIEAFRHGNWSVRTGFGLDSGTKTNLIGAVQTAQAAVNTTRTIVKAVAK
jgi:hypothetical protein